ncbi:alpha/beta fold hydrolase [uncultured Desulfuromonas sp.]|uniref:esterase/lipase family protein n=1 Tax=uncultured Desulfuromonas sp. TaxID=181013 RepID=UPI002AAAA522|nr:alpha/beta fold hydrolase [uncultured Desulfuromonas sp.]
MTKIVLVVLVALAILIAVCVLFSGVLFWYERANQDSKLLDQRFQLSRWSRILKIYTLEYLVTLASLLIYPLGLQNSKYPQRAKERPIVLLIHGLYLNRASSFYLQKRLKQGERHIITLNLPPWREVETLTECIDRVVHTLRQDDFTGSIDLVGHSLGGLIARNYVQRRGGDKHIRRCITVGAPHFGSKLVPFSISKTARQLAPDSLFIEQLSQSEWPESVDFYSIFSPLDNIVLPPGRSKHPAACNIEIANSGHVTLWYHTQTIRHLRQILTNGKTHD